MTRSMQAAVTAAVAAALSQIGTTQKSAKGQRRRRKAQPRVKANSEQLTANAAANDKVAEEYFAKLGMPGKARVDIRTFDGWLEAGRRVKKGEKSHKHPTKNYPLFHVSQTEPVETAEGSASVQ